MLKTGRNLLSGAALLALTTISTSAYASTFTTTSPTGGALPSGVTEIGGIVLDLTGLNGTRVVTEAPALSLFHGYAYLKSTKIGSQSGFSPAVIAALGGGISKASVRISLYDGDTQYGNFDYKANTLSVDGADFGDFSDVATQETSTDGKTVKSSSYGFGDNIISTGFFSSTNGNTLARLYNGLLDGSVDFFVNDVTPGDQFYDFTKGIDGSLVSVGTGPVITPSPVPLPGSLPMFGASLLALAAVAFGMKRRDSETKTA